MEVCAPRVGWGHAYPRNDLCVPGGFSEGCQVSAELPQVLSGSGGLNKKFCYLGRTLNKGPKLEGYGNGMFKGTYKKKDLSPSISFLALPFIAHLFIVAKT